MTRAQPLHKWIDVSVREKGVVWSYLSTSPGHASRRSRGEGAILLQCYAWLRQGPIDVRRSNTTAAVVVASTTATAAIGTLFIVTVVTVAVAIAVVTLVVAGVVAVAVVTLVVAVVVAVAVAGVVWDPNRRLGFARLPAACCQHKVDIDVATVPIRRSRLLQKLPGMQRLAMTT